jgi:hypothetical protein
MGKLLAPVFLDFLWMQANHRINETSILTGKFDGCHRRLVVDGRHEHLAYSSILCPLDDLRQIIAKFFAVQMSMCINHFLSRLKASPSGGRLEGAYHFSLCIIFAA